MIPKQEGYVIGIYLSLIQIAWLYSRLQILHTNGEIYFYSYLALLFSDHLNSMKRQKNLC